MKRLVILLPVLLAFQVGVQPALAWTWPVDGPVVRPFKLGDDPYAGGQHRGIDIGAPLGTSVRAPAGGTISFAGTVPTSGKSVTIQTPAGYSVTLVQLGTIGVTRGAGVAEGAVVGTVGPSGDPGAAPPHVHLGVRVTSDPNGYLDPLRFLPPRPAEAPEPEPAPAPAPEPAPAPAAEAPATPAASPQPTPPPQSVAEQPGVPSHVRPVEAPIRRHLEASRSGRLSAQRGIESAVRRGAVETPPGAQPSVRPARTERRSVEPLVNRVRPGVTAIDARGQGASWPWALLPVLLAAAAGLGVLRRQLRDAGATDESPAVFLERVVASAKDADALGLREEDRLVLDRDLERILLTEAKALPDLDRDHDATELVDVADDPGCGHPSRRTRRRSHRLSRGHGLRPSCQPVRAHM
jgi:peptidase M23-like protein